MAHYRTTVASKWDVARAFSYFPDFTNAATWDPGVLKAEKLHSGDVGLGTRFELRASFNGRQLPPTYEVSAFDPPRRVVLRAETGTVRSTDEITFTPNAQGTHVTYDADPRTRGWLKLAALVVAPLFGDIGDRARAGLRRELNV